MKFHLLRCFLVVAVILLTSVSYAQMPQGWWLFDNALDLTAAVPGYGSDLELTGSQTAVAGPSVGNGAISIDVGSYYKLTHGFAPNGGGTKVNEYTLMFDFKVANLNKWHTFFQTDMNVVGSDGDYFKNTSGMLGTWALNYSTTPIAVDTWYRLVISIDNGNFFKTYLDGALLQTHVPQAIDDRWSLDSYFYLFGDDDGDDGLIEIAEVAIWNYALTDAEVAAVGTIGTVVPVELTSFRATQSQGNVSLLWSTATELNNSGFEIQRKDVASDWRILGFVDGNGTTTNTQNYSFTDRPENSGTYSYRLKQIDFDGSFAYSKIEEVEVLNLPADFKLFNNYPNPFNPSTIISYDLPVDAFVTLKVYNSIGEMVTEIINEFQTVGHHQQVFNSTSNGFSLPSGIYFAELKANENVQRIKMMLLK